MDAKHVWRAALGELQVSLSPANYETWLRDTHLVDVDDHRFRIAVPNGFAKDWLESRYRSLISATLARVVGYSVQVEFVVAQNGDAKVTTAAPTQTVRVEATRVGSPEGASANLNTRYTFAHFIVGSAHPLPPPPPPSVAPRPRPPPPPRRDPVGRRAPRPCLQPALPVWRGRPRQDTPAPRHRERGR